MHPLDFITWYHVLILHIAAILRLLVAYDYVNGQLKEKKENFVWSIYFSDRWDNWLAHYISMWLGLLVLPSLVEVAGEWIPLLKKMQSSEAINIIATCVLGFFGYDALKWIFDKFKPKA